MSYKLDLVGVLGYPVAENPSCVMHEAAFRALGLPWRYLTMEVEPGRLAAAIEGVRALGMKGINLTMPHKVAVLGLLDEVAADAARIGAVNTVRREGDRLIGENTDGKGFLRGLEADAGMTPEGRYFVILGAGGAARAIASELAAAGAAGITVLNRDPGRGGSLCRDLGSWAKAEIVFQRWNAPYVVNPQTDVLVNATSIGLFPQVSDMPAVDLTRARPDLLVADIVPNPPETRLLMTARDQGFRTLGGLPMLVYQGAIGFRMWTGLEAPVAEMQAALQRAFAGVPDSTR